LAPALQYTAQRPHDSLRHKQNRKRRSKMETNKEQLEVLIEEPCILEEINVEELAIDGICGVY